MEKKELDTLVSSVIETAKNSLISIINKVFEQHNDCGEVCFNEEKYYRVNDGFCFPKKLYKNEGNKIIVEREFEWDDMTTETTNVAVDEMCFFGLVMFCDFLRETF